MPGVNKEGLEISVENNELTITGRRSIANIDGTITSSRIAHGKLPACLRVDPSIDTGKISAQDRTGGRTLHLPKAEHVKPRKITVQ